MSVTGHHVHLAPGQTLYNDLGGLQLAISLTDYEWQVRTERAPEPEESGEWRQWVESDIPTDDAALERFVRSGESGYVELRPALSDLPVVIRPYHPVHVPPDSDVTFYVSTIIWLQLVIDTGRVLMEIPVRRPSWTWIGADTMEGEICYASQTSARLDPATLPASSWRAMSAVVVRNRGSEYLTLERFSFPAPLTPLYRQTHAGADGVCRLWTPLLTINCERKLATASIRIANGPPDYAGECLKVASARHVAERSHLTRTVDRIFG